MALTVAKVKAARAARGEPMPSTPPTAADAVEAARCARRVLREHECWLVWHGCAGWAQGVPPQEWGEPKHAAN